MCWPLENLPKKENNLQPVIHKKTSYTIKKRLNSLTYCFHHNDFVCVCVWKSFFFIETLSIQLLVIAISVYVYQCSVVWYGVVLVNKFSIGLENYWKQFQWIILWTGEWCICAWKGPDQNSIIVIYSKKLLCHSNEIQSVLIVQFVIVACLERSLKNKKPAIVAKLPARIARNQEEKM